MNLIMSYTESFPDGAACIQKKIRKQSEFYGFSQDIKEIFFTRNKIQISSSGLQVWYDQPLLTSLRILPSCLAGPLYQLLASHIFAG